MSPSQRNPAGDITIASLAQQISSLSSQITAHLALNSLSDPTLSAEAKAGAVPDTAEYEALRAPLNDAALDLLRLVNGPKSTLRTLFFSHYDLAALQVALDRRFFDHVPLPSDGSRGVPTATVAEIAAKAGMDEDRAGRVLRLLATHRIFEEDEGEEGRFRHTAASAEFARDAAFNATADMQMDDMLKAVSETSTLIHESPYESSTIKSAFHQRFGTSMYQYYEENPPKAKRFGQAMSSWSQIDRQISELCESFAWSSLGEGKVVDIGGGSGHISIALARRFPLLKFVVQDISQHMLSQAEDDLNGRIGFQQHDFFSPQPVHDASAFLLRQCLHNYNDADSIKILRAVVPALEACAKGTPLLINDVILPSSHTVTRFEEHHLRQVDFCMMVALGAKQRSEQDWVKLLKEADERFAVVKVNRNPLGVGLVEVHLNVA